MYVYTEGIEKEQMKVKLIRIYRLQVVEYNNVQNIEDTKNVRFVGSSTSTFTSNCQNVI